MRGYTGPVGPTPGLVDYRAGMGSVQWDTFCTTSGIDPAAITGLGELDADAVEQLTTMFVAARENRSRELSAAVEAGIGFLPRLMRIPVRKIIFG